MTTQRIVCADALDYMRHVPSATFDMAFVDFPYGTTAHDRDLPVSRRMYLELLRVVRPRGVIVFTTSGPFSMRVEYEMMTDRERRRFLDDATAKVRPRRWRFDMIWHKPNATAGGANALDPEPRGLPLSKKGRRRIEPLRAHEVVKVYTPSGRPLAWWDPRPLERRGTPYNVADSWNPRDVGEAYAGAGKRHSHTSRPDGRRDPRTVVKWPNDARQGGNRVTPGPPYQKPQSMVTDLIEALCPPGGRVLEPCAGSAPMARAAKRTGRTCVSVERDEEYARAARAAWERHTWQTTM